MKFLFLNFFLILLWEKNAIDLNLDKDNICLNNNNKTNDLKVSCKNFLKKNAFKPLSKINNYSEELFKYIKKKILKPLGYKFSDNLDIFNIIKYVSLANKNNLRHKSFIKKENISKMSNDLYNEFKNYNKLDASNKDNFNYVNKEANRIVNKFKLYWILLYNWKNIKKTKSKTLKLLKYFIVKRNNSMENNVYFTKLILDQVRENYYNFMIAHKIKEYIKNHHLELIIYYILKRYKILIINYKKHNLNYEEVFKEILLILDLVKSYTYFSMKKNIGNEEILKIANFEIIDQIKEIFSIFSKYTRKTQFNIYSQVKDFTSLLILKTIRKIKTLSYNIKYRENWIDYEVNNKIIKIIDSNSMKAYYEIRDNLLQVSEICNYTDIINCYKKYINKIVSQIINKYQLISSKYGLIINKYIQNLCNYFFSTKNLKYFSHIKIIKLYYKFYSKLLNKLKISLNIKNLKTIEKLEINIGSLISEYKKYNLISRLDLDFVDHFDKDLYDYFWELKIQFNKLGDVKRDSKSINRIKLDFNEYLDNEINRNNLKNNEQIINLIKQVKILVEKWSIKYSLNYIIDISNDNIKNNNNKDIKFFNLINNIN